MRAKNLFNTPSPKSDRANGVRASRRKKFSDGDLPSNFLSVLSLKFSSPACQRTKPKHRPRNGQVSKPVKLCPAVKCLRCRANVKCCPRQRYGSTFRSRLSLLRHRTKPKTRPRNVQVSKPTKNDSDFAVVCLSVRSSFERGILRADESRPRSSILCKTKYRRKRSRQNLAHLPACAVKPNTS